MGEKSTWITRRSYRPVTMGFFANGTATTYRGSHDISSRPRVAAARFEKQWWKFGERTLYTRGRIEEEKKQPTPPKKHTLGDITKSNDLGNLALSYVHTCMYIQYSYVHVYNRKLVLFCSYTVSHVFFKSQDCRHVAIRQSEAAVS